MQKTGKLELTWVGKYEEKELETRILIEDKSKSYGDPDSGNMLIHGDNLIALKALEQDFAGKIKCIYIDPPYNTGSRINSDGTDVGYDDGLEHSEWLHMMKPQLEILSRLLADEGSIWIQIDDEEQAYLKVLCDEIFGRQNFVNMISVNMKNIAGASGGGEDKRLKKNCEYILIYAKNYEAMPLFKGAYDYTELSELIQNYIDNGISWKYTSVLVNDGEKEFVGNALDGDGNDIRVFRRKNPVIKSIRQVAQLDEITEQEAYRKYGTRIFRTTNAQSSIRTRIIAARRELNLTDSILSIEYIPKTGKNKGQVYEQFYKDDICNLFVWLKDTSEEIDGVLYKKMLQGTYWDFNAHMKNLTKEGSVVFARGKKPEALVHRIFKMTTSEDDIVLDSFLGSGTTAAVAQKIGRRWIGIELGDHAYTHCNARLDKVIDGEQGGISKAIGWEGGGGYKFYELAPSLLEKHSELPIYKVNKFYTYEMLCEAICKLEGFKYIPQGEMHGRSSETRFIHIAKDLVSAAYVMNLLKDIGEKDSVLICGTRIQSGLRLPDNVIVKKIPKDLLDKCVFESEVR
ncbi:MAG: site-specific DNA-methyltransferase [Christensenellaceae bacterium]|jgi:adenine-specific DNA-methyltransferase|nr:site-specific DNA-methyltransferase [Christensenellaceae bacterium]